MLADDRDPNVLARRAADMSDERDTARTQLAKVLDDLGHANTHRMLQAMVVDEAQNLRAALCDNSGVPAHVIADFDLWMKTLKEYES